MSAPNEIKFRFNPSSSKSKKVLGPLEGEIMEVVWEQGSSTVAAVHKVLRDKKDIAYTTVMTTMGRLAKKKLLEQDRSSTSYIYRPVISRMEFELYVVTSVINALLDDFGDGVIETFVNCIRDRGPEAEAHLRRALSE